MASLKAHMNDESRTASSCSFDHLRQSPARAHDSGESKRFARGAVETFGGLGGGTGERRRSPSPSAPSRFCSMSVRESGTASLFSSEREGERLHLSRRKKHGMQKRETSENALALVATQPPETNASLEARLPATGGQSRGRSLWGSLRCRCVECKHPRDLSALDNMGSGTSICCRLSPCPHPRGGTGCRAQSQLLHAAFRHVAPVEAARSPPH